MINITKTKKSFVFRNTFLNIQKIVYKLFFKYEILKQTIHIEFHQIEYM